MAEEPAGMNKVRAAVLQRLAVWPAQVLINSLADERNSGERSIGMEVTAAARMR
jgi:hypothetical protein